VTSPPVLGGDDWAWLELEGPGWLLMAVAADLPDLRARVTRLPPETLP